MVPASRPPFLRHVAAQIHRWIGLVLAAYLLVLSVTGSLIVLRPQFHRWLTQPQLEVGVPLAGESREGALRRAYPASSSNPFGRRAGLIVLPSSC